MSDFNYEVIKKFSCMWRCFISSRCGTRCRSTNISKRIFSIRPDLEILPVINKIDLPSARPDEIKAEIEDIIGLDASEAPLVSAKSGLNIQDVLEDIVNNVPAPEGDIENH